MLVKDQQLILEKINPFTKGLSQLEDKYWFIAVVKDLNDKFSKLDQIINPSDCLKIEEVD